MPGVACVLTGSDLGDIDPYWGHAIRDRPIVAIDRVRFHGEPVAAVAADDEATAERALLAIDVDVRGAPGRGHRRRGDRAGSAARQRRPAAARALPRPGRAPAARRQRLLPLPHRARRGGGRVRARRHRGRGRVRVPRRLPVRDGDPHGDRPGRAGRDHALGDLPAPVPRARRDRGAVRAAALVGARDRALPRRRLRLEVVYEDGADHGRARAQGAAPGAHPERDRASRW